MKRKIENDKRAEEREYSLAGVGRGGGDVGVSWAG
jgi:hypothetical protein